MTQLLKISCVLLGISFSLRLHTPIAFGLCVLFSFLIIIFEKRRRIYNWILRAKERRLVFLLTILFINSISFLVLTFIFSYEINYLDQIINILFTFLFYVLFVFIFDFIEKIIIGRRYAG